MPPGSQRSQSSPHFAATPAVSGKKCVFNFDYDFKIIVFLRDDTFLEGEFASKMKRNFSKWHCSEKCFSDFLQLFISGKIFFLAKKLAKVYVS